MMVHFFRDQSRARHKTEGLVEIPEHEFFRDGVAACRLGPAGEPCQRGFASISRELYRHDMSPLEPSCSERMTLEKGPGRYYLLPGGPDHTRHHVLVIEYWQGSGHRRPRSY